MEYVIILFDNKLLNLLKLITYFHAKLHYLLLILLLKTAVHYCGCVRFLHCGSLTLFLLGVAVHAAGRNDHNRREKCLGLQKESDCSPLISTGRALGSYLFIQV